MHMLVPTIFLFHILCQIVGIPRLVHRRWTEAHFIPQLLNDVRAINVIHSSAFIEHEIVLEYSTRQ